MEQICISILSIFGILLVLGLIFRISELIEDQIRKSKDKAFLKTHRANKGCRSCKYFDINNTFCKEDMEVREEFDSINGNKKVLHINYNKSKYKIRNEIGACPLFEEGQYIKPYNIDKITITRESQGDYDYD